MQRLAMFSIRLALTFFAVEAIVLAGTGLANGDGYSNSFQPYAALMPGQPAANLSAFSCRAIELAGTAAYFVDCQLKPENNHIVFVTVTVQNSTIHQVSFWVDEIVAAELFLHWGQPEVIEPRGRDYIVRWRNGFYAVVDPINPVRRFAYMMPIEVVTIGVEMTAAESH